jgi:hypothetical protein
MNLMVKSNDEPERMRANSRTTAVPLALSSAPGASVPEFLLKES